MAFTDDYPLNPPGLPEDWSQPVDRNQHDSLDEVRNALLEIDKLLSGLRRITFTLANGRMIDMLGRENGFETASYGFAVSEGPAPNTARVSPSVVSGMAGTAAVPVIGTAPLTDTPAPILNGVSNNKWVALWMEILPDTHQLYIVGGGEDEVWVITEGGGSLVGDIEVKVYATADAMNEAAVLPVIDPSDGTVISNGEYVIPLAQKDSEGEFRQIGYFGPLGVRMCSSGAVVAMAPARGPAAI